MRRLSLVLAVLAVTACGILTSSSSDDSSSGGGGTDAGGDSSLAIDGASDDGAGDASADAADADADVSVPSACDGSVCTIATGQKNAWAIAVSPTHVYWTNRVSGSGTVNRAPKSGGGSIETVATDDLPSSVALSDTKIFWASQSGVFSRQQATLGGGVSGGVAGANGVVWDGAQLFFSVPTGVYAGSSAVTDATPRPLSGNGVSLLSTIAVDATWVYMGSSSLNGSIRRVERTGAAPQDQTADQAPTSEVVSMATLGGRIYFSDANGLRYLPTQNSLFVLDPPQTAVASITNLVTGIATDGTLVYFVDDGGAVKRWNPGTGGPPVTLTTGPDPGVFCAVDADRVYWTWSGAGGFGGVMSVLKN